MSGRAAGRRAGRDNTKDNQHDFELEILNNVLESIRKAKELNDASARLGQEILVLEEEMRNSSPSATPDQHRKLDELYRKKLRNAEAERKVHEEEDIASKIAILATMRGNDEPVLISRGAGGGKASRTKQQHQQHQQEKQQQQHRPIIESDVSVDGSGGVSPAETTASTSNIRVDVLKRKQSGYGPRGSTPSSGPGRPTTTSSTAKEALSSTRDAPKDTSTSSSTTDSSDQPLHRGVLAEKNNDLKIGTEVFYKYSKSVADDVGVGIQCIIKKVHSDRRPIIYDVQDPEPDPSGKQSVHRATAKDLYPIPSSSSLGSDAKGVTFAPGATVYARYPDTDTFYRAKVVRGLKGGEYTLRFEGEEDDTEKGVERRFVLDTRMR